MAKGVCIAGFRRRVEEGVFSLRIVHWEFPRHFSFSERLKPGRQVGLKPAFLNDMPESHLLKQGARKSPLEAG
jgi:hypothetical protein